MATNTNTIAFHGKTIVNRYPGSCTVCKTRVPAEEGVTGKHQGRWIVWCAEHDPSAPVIVEFSLSDATSVTIDGTASAELMAHQAQVVSSVAGGARSIYLADEPGLGKTAQAAVSLVAAESHRAVIVVPAVVKTNWAREIERWTPGREVEVVEGRKAEGRINRDTNVIILNYELLSAHLDRILAWNPDALIVDEAHFVKERRSARTQAVAAVAEAVGDGLKMYLSGTPIPNRPIELAEPLSHLGLLDSLGGFWDFAERYANAHQTQFGWDMTGAQNLNELHEKLTNVGMVRRRKSEVIDLPERTVIDLPVALAGDGARDVKAAQVALTRRLVTAVKEEAAEEGLSLKKIDFNFVRRTVGRELSGSVGFAEIASLRKLIGIGKIDLIVAQAESLLQSGAVVVFAHHRAVVDGVAEALEASGHRVGLIVGGQSATERQSVVDGFQAGDLDVIVASLDAAGVGITLHRASQVVIGELPWTAAGQDQAIDRVHRIGQDAPVTAWRVIASSTLDKKLADAGASKRGIAAAAIDGEDRAEAQGKALSHLIAELVATALKVSVPTDV